MTLGSGFGAGCGYDFLYLVEQIGVAPRCIVLEY